MGELVSIILAGGRGERLHPLTKSVAKPALTFGGENPLIDLPLLTSIEALAERIFVLTQYKTNSIIQRISENFDLPLIEILCGRELRLHFAGTADAVRKVTSHLAKTSAEHFLILPGDQIHDFDVRDFIAFAKEKQADCTIAALPTCQSNAERLGILQIDGENRITRFVEKPTNPKIVKSLHSFPEEPHLLGSMGIYLFRRKALFDLLEKDLRKDFGKHLIPTQIEMGRTFCFIHHGHWEDIGTIASFHRSSIALVDRLGSSYIAPCASIKTPHIERSILGPKTRIGKETNLKATVHLGLGSVGERSYIEGAIIDKNASIGNDVVLKGRQLTFENENLCVRSGIIVVKEGAKIRDGFRL